MIFHLSRSKAGSKARNVAFCDSLRRNHRPATQRLRANEIAAPSTLPANTMRNPHHSPNKKPLPTRNAEAVKNYPRGVRTIECVEVNAGNVVIQKIVTLFQGEMNADAPDPFRIVFASLKSTQKLGRKACAAGELSHAFESAHGSN